MVGCFYDFGQCFLQPDGCSLKLPPTWSHRSPCAKVVWGLEAQVHGPFSTFHRGWKPWVMVDPEVVDPNNKKEIWNDGWYGHEKKLGYLEASGTLFLFLLLVILKVPTKQFWCQWFWSSAIIVFDQEINDDTPYLFFTISGDLLMRVVQYGRGVACDRNFWSLVTAIFGRLWPHQLLRCHFSWQAQYSVMLECHFSWQAHYLVMLEGQFLVKFG